MSKPGIKTNATAWQPTTQAASKSIFTARPFPEIGQHAQETVGYGEKAAQSLSRSGGMIENINRSMSKNSIPAVSNVGIEGVQAKLTIGEPGDQYEQEADRVAADVVQKMNAPEASLITSPQRVEGEDKSIQRKPSIPTLMRMPAPREQMQRKNEIKAGNVPQVQADFEGQLNQARGGGAPLDAAFRAKIEPEMGTDFSGVRVHTDSRADQMSQTIQAKAFTTGQDVFFRQGAYEPGSRGGQELIAHELTHVVQQTGTIQPSIQRYQIIADKKNKFRTSDDGQMAVGQDNSVGGQTAYATPALIQDASKKLKAATSVIELEPGSLSAKLDDLGGKKHNVVDVVPINTGNNTKDMDMELWADCGRSAKTVSGMDRGTGQGNASPGAKYKKDGKTKTVAGADWMDIQKVKMFMDLFNKKSSWWEVWKPTYENKLDIATLNKKLIEYDTVKKKWAVEADTTKKGNLAQQMAQLASEMDVLVRVEYEKLSPDAKDDFDKKAGINMYANPNIGEAFHISTGGNEHPGKPANVGTWNFHWAGVVMKSGSDSMTLENYSVSDYEEENKDWVFQMYGVGKKGQSFHEEHKDVHKQHGDAPTSMVAVRRKSQEE